ncbi:hypothetical protein COE51_01240 [Bacillus pseudomycoides]|nr:hypothetical protein COE51_01240 [Bacillus pseudomycoides]
MSVEYLRYYGVKVVNFLSILFALIFIFNAGKILTGIGFIIGGQIISYIISGGRSSEQLKRDYYGY